MRALALIAVSSLASFALAGCDAEPTNSVQYYKDNGDERTAVIHQCAENPGEEKLKPNCANAKRALQELSISPTNRNVPVIR